MSTGKVLVVLLSWCSWTCKSLFTRGQEQGHMKCCSSGSLLSRSVFRNRLEHSCFVHLSLSRPPPQRGKSSGGLRRGDGQERPHLVVAQQPPSTGTTCCRLNVFVLEKKYPSCLHILMTGKKKRPRGLWKCQANEDFSLQAKQSWLTEFHLI